MSDQIIVTNPTVRETQVTVKNVMIGKRQLTQRVFKQIQYEEFLDIYDGKPKGEVWGYVNYFWKENDHLKNNSKHVLWVTHDGELRRAFIRPHDLKANPFKDKLHDTPLYVIRTYREGDSNDLSIEIHFNEEFRWFLESFDVENINPGEFELKDAMVVLRETIKNRSQRWTGRGWELYTEGSTPDVIHCDDYRDKEYLEKITESYPEALKYLKGNMLIVYNTIILASKEYEKTILPVLHRNYEHYDIVLEQLYIAV